MSTFRKQFGLELERRRLVRGWSATRTVKEANRMAGPSGPSFHVTVLRRWEDGTAQPSVEQALYICRVLGISLLELTLPREPEPWIDGSPDTLDELEDCIDGRSYVEVLDADTGLRDVVVVTDPAIALGELSEIAEEDR